MTARCVVVTGGAGFIGSAVCLAFARAGERVTAIVRPGSTAAAMAALPAEVERLELDLAAEPRRLADVLRRIAPAVVVHAAVRNAHAAHDLAATVAGNVVATANLLAAIAPLDPPPRLVALGSSTEYGRAPGPITDTAPLAPVTSHGATRAAASLLVLAEAAAGRVVGGVLRPFTVYGPWEPAGRLVPEAIRAALTSRELPLAPTTAAHDFVFVDDVATACVLAADTPAFPGAAWNLCTGEPVTNEQLLERIEQATGRSIRRRPGGFDPRPLDRPDWYGDPSRTRSGLGWSATTTLADGLAACVDFWSAALRRERGTGAVGASAPELR